MSLQGKRGAPGSAGELHDQRSQGSQRSGGERPSVLVLGPREPDLLQPIGAFADPVPYWEHGSVTASRAAALGEFRALVSTGDSVVQQEFLEQLPALEVIANYGVGYDGIDLAAANERRIMVSNTPDVLTEEVADLALALALALRRRLVQADRYVREGRWEAEGPMPLTDRFHRKRIGLAGLGRIGRAVARRLEGFDAEIAYFDVVRHDVPYRLCTSLAELARESDMLIVTMPGGPATRGAISAEVLAALGPEGSLVNVSRGSVVDEPALIAALKEGRIGGAALDVFANEPHVPQALKEMDNVVLSPHHASGTWETREAMRDLVVQNLKNWHEGRPLVTPVNECR